MKLRIGTSAAALLMMTALAVGALAQKPEYRISNGYTHKNLTIFLIHGKDQNKKGNILTLQEAMERKIFVVYETSNVNELEVENLSKEFEVFIQSGDIVKGGKQDRVLAVSIIIPARSGRISIESFCVESGRWTKRGDEDSTKFNSSNDRIVTKDLKIAANGARSQQEVWDKVAEAQTRLSKSVGGTVNSTKSASSLQLSLENKKVVALIDEYIAKLSGVIDGQSDVIGFAYAVNGKVNSADVYVSNALFKKVWGKMLKASATEAVAESNGVRLADPVKSEAVLGMIADVEKARSNERSVGAGTKMVTRENKENVLYESRDAKSDMVIHRSYVKIQ